MDKREFIQAYVLARAGCVGPGKGLDAVGAARVAGDAYDAILAATPEPADEGWIDHRGEKPYPEGVVEFVCRNGESGVVESDDLLWEWDPEDPTTDIIRWRPARA